jgi:hypothetical protein
MLYWTGAEKFILVTCSPLPNAENSSATPKLHAQSKLFSALAVLSKLISLCAMLVFGPVLRGPF